MAKNKKKTYSVRYAPEEYECPGRCAGCSIHDDPPPVIIAHGDGDNDCGTNAEGAPGQVRGNRS